MPIKGTDVAKKLPQRKGCKDCGFPTCFAFAMKLASGGATVDKCPYLSEEIRAELEDALAPPIKLVTVGSGEGALKIGNEEVIYRHEKTFAHAPGIAVLISDKEDEGGVEDKIAKMKELQFERVGLTLRADLFALKFQSGDKAKYEALVKKVCDAGDAGIILISEDLGALFAARDICAGRNPLLYPITKDNLEQAIPLIKQSPTPVGVKAESVEALIPLTSRLKEEGIEELVLDPGSGNFLEVLRDQTLIRRAALKQNFRPLGYPTIVFPCFLAGDGLKEILTASMCVIKFAGIIVLSDLKKDSLLPLLVQRLNIYTDPRMPLAIEQGVYEVGQPKDEAPVLITSNWSLTYFLVSSATEESKVHAFVCVKDTEGLGVVTSWGAGKFSGDSVGAFIKKSGIEERVKHRKLVIPGKVARIRGELEEALPGWEIVVGPREAGELPGFLPALARSLTGG
ncbi:MAG: acetyl-CoA decarbonylase/synthase complex subunit gamma [Dehalococcoidia bacterium]|nr:acetyl-CoA decarbonylase/synthase complex subunit gamma [Dehalococcoidia bacterium]